MKSKNLIEVEPYGALSCAAKVFQIKGKRADLDEFVTIIEEGNCYECDTGDCDGYCGCHGMYAHAIGARAGVLKKYDITVDEFNYITDKLEEVFAVGDCGLCI